MCKRCRHSRFCFKSARSVCLPRSPCHGREEHARRGLPGRVIAKRAFFPWGHAGRPPRLTVTLEVCQNPGSCSQNLERGRGEWKPDREHVRRFQGTGARRLAEGVEEKEGGEEGPLPARLHVDCQGVPRLSPGDDLGGWGGWRNLPRYRPLRRGHLASRWVSRETVAHHLHQRS